MIKVGVVVPTYNNERYLASTVNSLLAQTLTDWVLQIVDDGSSDRTLSLAERLAASDPRIRVLHQENGGTSIARNSGYAQLPETEYVFFLDHDDVLGETFLEELSAYLDTHPEVGTVYCRYQHIDKNGMPGDPPPSFARYRSGAFGIPLLIPDLIRDVPFESLMAYMMAIPSSALIRRSVYDQTNGWDPGVRYGCEDNDMFLRLAMVAPVHDLPRYLLSFRIHTDSRSAQPENRARSERELEEKWWQGKHLSRKGRRRSRRAIAFGKRLLSIHYFKTFARQLLSGSPIRASRTALRGTRCALVASFASISAWLDLA